MRPLLAAALSAWLAAGPARAQPQREEEPIQDDAEPATPGVVEHQAEVDVAKRVADALAADAGMRSSLAGRILKSRIAASIAGEEKDPKAAVESWIQSNPKDAAHLALGFAQDDETGADEFEESLTERVKRFLRLNPDRHGGLLGVLKAAGGESKTIRKLGKKMDEEEQRELVKKLFEGAGGAQGRVLKGPGEDDAGGGKEPANPDSVAGASAYDRLSQLNPSGYSPDVLSLQSSLNSQRPPGAPKLVETGRLDFQTLAFPLYALRADLSRQESSLRARQAAAAAAALGRSAQFKAADYADPRVQAELEKALPAGKLPGEVTRRREALANARLAAEQFKAAAERMREPSRVTKAALRELSARQKETARWLLVSSLYADVERLTAEAKIWTPELRETIQRVAVADDDRKRFSGRADSTLDRLRRIVDHDQNALRILLGPEYAARWGEVERELARGNALRKDLSRDLSLVARIPGGLYSAGLPPTGWRAFAERWARRLAPSSRWAREAESRERRIGAWREAFTLVAAGDFTRAQRAAENAGR